MADVLQCPGCHAMVDVGRPDGVDWHLDRGRPESGEETVTIRIGQVVVHRCRLCPDGIWR